MRDAAQQPDQQGRMRAEQAIRWSGGRAIVATGSPFADVTYGAPATSSAGQQRVHLPPASGSARPSRRSVRSRPRCSTSRPPHWRATSGRERLDAGAIYPDQTELRHVSFEIACAVVRYAKEHNLGRRMGRGDRATVRAAVWDPKLRPGPRAARPDHDTSGRCRAISPLFRHVSPPVVASLR